jgi:Skp family chaperone for outer membrane proteins
MEAQQNELMQQQEDLKSLQQSLTMQLSQDQESMTQRLYDSVINNIPIINDGRFVLVLGDAVGANILYSEQTMDITREVLDFLNSRYNSTETE